MSFFRVIIPNNNSEPWIEQGLKSIFYQTCKDWKLVIVDDASVDNSVSIIKKYVDQYPITLVELKDKKGFPGDVRNIGIQYATDSEYTLFMDSDDWFADNEIFAKVKSKADETHADVIRMPFLMYQGGSSMLRFPLPDDDVKAFATSPFIAPWTKAIKTSVMVEFPPETMFEDIVHHLRLADKIDTVTHIDDYCYVWNRQPSNNGSVTMDIDSTEWKRRKYHASLFRLYAHCIYTKYNRDFVQAMSDSWANFARETIQKEKLL